jgi:general secretion pathway protein D
MLNKMTTQVMLQPHSNWKKCLILILAFGLGAGTQLHAQPGPGGFGGFGGFSGGGFGGRSRSSTSSSQYPKNGAVGDAVISIDPETHNLVVIADDETAAHISQVISNLDRPQPQVLIKVVFLEVERNKGLDLGVDGSFRATTGYSPTTTMTTNYSLINGGTTSNAIVPSFLGPVTSMLPSSFLTGSNLTGGGLISGLQSSPSGFYSIIGQDYTVTLHALASAGNAKVLSRPSVIARNNQPATIMVGQQVPLITSVRYDTFGNVINGVTYTEVGIILRVTPFITSDGLVQMILSPEISKVAATGGQTISSGPLGQNPIVAPAIDKRSADTVVVTPDGQTVIIGGLIEDSKAEVESKIPFLGDIPLLGNLFKRKVTTDGKTELLIFLTPRVIQAPSEVASLTTNEKARSEGVKAFQDKELDKFFDTLPVKNSTKKPAKAKAVPPTGSN